ncbi:MAG: PQQ-binding-like beta-propeller repeat protein [Fimbriimonadaceae bacterium]|nr:PQQ-binding-like beta-propeller repeat protein [Fimbriimonadaceae bacterium]
MSLARRMAVLAAGALLAGPTLAQGPLWQVKVPGYGDKPTVLDVNSDGKLDVIVATDKGNVAAVSGADGSLLWKATVDGEQFYSCPVVVYPGDGPRILCTGSRYGTVLCLNPDGSVAWKKDGSGDGILGQPAGLTLPGGAMLVYTQLKQVVALNVGSGEPRWTVDLPDKSEGGVTIGDLGDGGPSVLVLTLPGKLLCFDGEGSPKWTTLIGGRPVKPALIADLDGDRKPEIYVVGKAILRLDAAGKQKWQWVPKSGRGASSALAVCGKLLAAAFPDGGLYGINALGKQVFRYTVVPTGNKAVPGSTPAMCDLNGDGVPELLMCSPRFDDPRLLVVNGKTGALLMSAQTTRYSHSCPVVADLNGDGLVEATFCCPTEGSNGTLTALKLGRKAAPGWVKFAGDLACSGSLATALQFAAEVIKPR